MPIQLERTAQSDDGCEAVRALQPTVETSVRNQTIFREVNEHIAKLAGDWLPAKASMFICECGDGDCIEPLELTPAEYERVRANDDRFVVCPGHRLPELERVVEGNDRFAVVEKLGPAAEIARSADPRRMRPEAVDVEVRR